MSTDTETKPESAIERVGKLFAIDTAKHEIEIVRDDGPYRHVKFRGTPKWNGWYDLITVPGALIFRGDYESLVFARTDDMFEFFRSNPDRLTMRISPAYWAEKLTSDRDSVKQYSRESFEQYVSDILGEAVEEYPGIIEAWTEHVGEGWEAYDLDFEESARAALNEFEHGDKIRVECSCGRSIEAEAHDGVLAELAGQHLGHFTRSRRRIEGFRFTDTWECDFKDFTHAYLWALHAIVTGIARYDAAKAADAKQAEAVAAP